MSLICHASLTDSVYRSIHGYNDQQLLLPKTRYNKLHTSEHTRLQWPTITPCYNSIQQTPHHWTSLYFYYGVPPYGEIILKKENTWKQCITWVLCINSITWATIVQHLNPLPVYLHITNATWNVENEIETKDSLERTIITLQNNLCDLQSTQVQRLS